MTIIVDFMLVIRKVPLNEFILEMICIRDDLVCIWSLVTKEALEKGNLFFVIQAQSILIFDKP